MYPGGGWYEPPVYEEPVTVELAYKKPTIPGGALLQEAIGMLQAAQSCQTKGCLASNVSRAEGLLRQYQVTAQGKIDTSTLISAFPHLAAAGRGKKGALNVVIPLLSAQLRLHG
jgi:hypothetical protein